VEASKNIEKRFGDNSVGSEEFHRGGRISWILYQHVSCQRTLHTKWVLNLRTQNIRKNVRHFVGTNPQWIGFSGKIYTGNHRFSYEIWGFPVNFPGKTKPLKSISFFSSNYALKFPAGDPKSSPPGIFFGRFRPPFCEWRYPAARSGPLSGYLNGLFRFKMV